MHVISSLFGWYFVVIPLPMSVTTRKYVYKKARQIFYSLRIQVYPKKGIDYPDPILWHGNGIIRPSILGPGFFGIMHIHHRGPITLSYEDDGSGCPITGTKRKVFRFHKTILRRWVIGSVGTCIIVLNYIPGESRWFKIQSDLLIPQLEVTFYRIQTPPKATRTKKHIQEIKNMNNENRAFKEIYPRNRIINTLWPWNGQTRRKKTHPFCVKPSNLPGFYWHLFWAPCWEFLSHMLHGTGIIIYFIIFLFQPNVGKYFMYCF